MILSVLALICVCILIPYCIGLLPVLLTGRARRSAGVTYLLGVILCFAVFQIVTVPIVIYKPFGFTLVTIVYTVLLCVLAVLGVFVSIKYRRKHGFFFAENAFKRNLTKEEIVEWIMAAIMMLFVIFMYVTRASFDGDDAYYVANSLLSYETDTLYRIKPYTGLSTGLDLRHALAVFPIWVAYMAKISRIHPTIMSHSIIGGYLIPLTCLVYYEIGKTILKKERKKLPIFMIFVGIMQLFGNVSIYTNATFFLTRTWQGKSMLANFIIPVAIWLLLNIFESEGDEDDMRLGLWIMLGLNNIMAAMCSTASVFLMAMLIGVSGLILTIREKNIQIALRLVITCIPLVLYGVIFLVI